MAVSEELFKLIKSLSKSEKRYFKLYAELFTSRNKNVYVILFDQIEKQKEYNEPKVLRAFRLKGIKVDLPSLKLYLYDLILKCLRSYKTELSVNEKINELISSANILISKGLYTQAKKYLKKAKTLAEENEAYTLLVDITSIEGKNQQFFSKHEDFEEGTNKNYHLQLEIIKTMEEALHYRNLNAKAFILHNKIPFIRNQEHLNQFQELITHPYMDIEKARNKTSKLIYYGIMGGYYHNIMEYEKLYMHSQKQLDIIKSSETLMKTKNDALMIAYANVISSCINTDRKFEALKFLKQKNEDLQKPIFKKEDFLYKFYITNCIFLELMLYVHFGDVPNALSLIKNKFNEVYSEEPPYYMKENEFLLYCTRTYLLAEDYKKAEDMLIILLNRPYSKAHSYFNSLARFLNLIIHFELEHFNLLDHLVVSCYRFVLKRKDSFKTEKEIVSLLRKAGAAVDKKERLEVFKQSLEKLNELKNEQFEKPAFAYFDYTLWLRSKVEGKSMLELN